MKTIVIQQTETYLSKSLHETLAEKFPLGRGIKAAGISVCINAILAIVKIVVGIIGNAYALVADGIESSVDVVSSIIVWHGLRIASRPPDDDHPYGHWRAEPLAALVVSSALILLGFAIAIQSVREILIPHQMPASYTLIVLVVVIVIKEILFRFMHGRSNEVSSSALKADAWHHRSDALTSIAAFIGISIAILAGPGYESADDWAALVACFIILYNGVKLGNTALREIMDEAPAPELEWRLRDLARDVVGVMGIDLCRIRKSGPALFVEMHVLVSGNMTVQRGHEIAHEVKNTLRENEPGVFEVIVHLEPAK